MTISDFIPAFIFVGLIFLLVFWIVYSAKTIDEKLQNLLKFLFSKKHSVVFGKIEKNKKYLKKIGEGIFRERKFKIFTNNNEAYLNRQIIFELEIKPNSMQPFTIFRYPKYTGKNNQVFDFEKVYAIYRIPYSKFYDIGSKFQMAKETFNTKNSKEVFQILQHEPIRSKILKIPLMRKVFFVNAYNNLWKIFFEKDHIGFEIESSWIKSMKLGDLEDFFEVVNLLADYLNDKVESKL